MTFGTFAQPLNLDPGVINESESAQVANNIYETLVEYDSETNRFFPVLATGWSSSPDNKSWTFNLRRNVKFHNGTDFNAHAVKFSWDRQRVTSHPYHNPGYGRFTFYRAAWGGYPGNIKKIEVIDSHTLKVELYYKDNNFLKIISNLPFAIVSPSAVKKFGNRFTKNPVGTGKFKFVDWRNWQRILLKANLDHWNSRPNLDYLIFEPTPGRQSRHRQISREFVDIIENPDPQLYNLVKNRIRDHLYLMKEPGYNFSFISLNCQKPPLDIPLVRKALCFAIDKNRIIKKLQAKYKNADSPVISMFNTNIETRNQIYNPGTARALLKKAGFPRGFTLELLYLKSSRPFLTDQEDVAREIARDLEKVGITVNISGLRWESYLEKLRFGVHQAALTGFVGIDYQPEIYFQQCWAPTNAVLGGTNISFYRNEKIQSLLTSASFTHSDSALLGDYRQIQEILANDNPLVPLFHNHTILCINQRVQNVKVNRKGLIDFSRVWLKK
ncbi:MAG: ABC transporter substrate-binding protein [Vulcanimicrobiota bacterium]